MTDSQFAIAKDAIAYTLMRIRTDPDAHYAIGAGTEAFRRLCLAYASLTGEPFDSIEARMRQTDFGHSVGRFEQLEERVRALENSR